MRWTALRKIKSRIQDNPGRSVRARDGDRRSERFFCSDGCTNRILVGGLTGRKNANLAAFVPLTVAYAHSGASLLDYEPAAFAVSSTASAGTGFFAGVVVITITLTRMHAAPAIVRGSSASPPRKYPTSTAITGFT